MKVAIVNGFDTFEHRAELLLSFFQTRNYDTVVLQSDFHHIKKEKRQGRKENFYFIYSSNFKRISKREDGILSIYRGKANINASAL